jgi:hypothetical protein
MREQQTRSVAADRRAAAPKSKKIKVHHIFLKNVRYGIHRRRLKPAAIYSKAPLGLLLFY